MIVEAIDTAITLCRALAGWLLLAAVVVALLVLGVVAVVGWAADRAWRALTGHRSHEHPHSAPE